jgi:hypothetical protein
MILFLQLMVLLQFHLHLLQVVQVLKLVDMLINEILHHHLRRLYIRNQQLRHLHLLLKYLLKFVLFVL